MNNDADYHAEQSALWAAYTASASRSLRDFSSPQSLHLLNNILNHMNAHKHLSCALEVANEVYEVFIANGTQALASANGHLSLLVGAHLDLGNLTAAYYMTEQLVIHMTSKVGPDHVYTKQVMETLDVVRQVKEQREEGEQKADAVIKKYEDWKEMRTDDDLRLEIGNEAFEERKKNYENARLIRQKIQVDDVCQEAGGCQEKQFDEVHERLGSLFADLHL